MSSIWEMWRFEKREGNRVWRDNFASMGTTTSVQNIQKSYSEFLLPSRLGINCSYLFFKQGIRPEWEDNANRNGGRWATYGERSLLDPLIMNKQWFMLLITVLESSFGEYAEHICGCQIDIRRKNYRISIWTGNKYDRDACTSIGQVTKDVVSPNTKWDYEDHESNDRNQSSCKVKSLYQLKE